MKVNDDLRSFIGALGDPLRDKAAGVFYTVPFITDDELNNMYRGSWLPRKIVNIPAHDSVRAWRQWFADDVDISMIEAEEKRLNVQNKIKEAFIKARLFGGSLIYMGIPNVGDPARPLDPSKIKKGDLRYLTVIHRSQVGVGNIDWNPDSENYEKPEFYSINGRDFHASRFMRFVGAEIPDLRSTWGPSYGWGDSVLLAMKTAIQQMDSSIANVASLIFEANVDVFGIPDFLGQMSNPAYKSRMLERFALVAANKSVNQAILIDAQETYERKTVAFTQLPELIEKFMQNVAGACDIPATRLLGMSPAGMSSTGESDLRNYYDGINANQNLDLTPKMTAFDEMLQRSATGDFNPDVWYEWRPLWQISAKERADIGKITAETASSLVNSGLIKPEALADAVVNALTETAVFPGLDEAVSELPPIDFEAEAKAEQERALAAAKKPGMTADMAPKPLYVSRKVLNAADIIKWAKSAGLSDLIPADELHVTLVYSETPLDWFKIGESWSEEIKIPAGGPRVLEQFGAYVVLRFNSEALTWRREAILSAGASATYPEYKPHISLIQALPGVLKNVEEIPAYTGEIVLGPEIFEDIK